MYYIHLLLLKKEPNIEINRKTKCIFSIKKIESVICIVVPIELSTLQPLCVKRINSYIEIARKLRAKEIVHKKEGITAILNYVVMPLTKCVLFPTENWESEWNISINHIFEFIGS